MAPTAVAVCMAPAHNAHESAFPSNIPRFMRPQVGAYTPNRGDRMSEARRKSKGPIRGYFFDKSVLVTGASSGIGLDVAIAFGEQGAKVAVLARRRTHLDELAKKIDKAGGKALAIDCDVTDRARVFSAVEQVKESFGKVDILINSAGVLIPDPVEQMRPEDL